jgi:hypothetical protein
MSELSLNRSDKIERDSIRNYLLLDGQNEFVTFIYVFSIACLIVSFGLVVEYILVNYSVEIWIGEYITNNTDFNMETVNILY